MYKTNKSGTKQSSRLNSFSYVNAHNVGFHPQTQRFVNQDEQHCKKFNTQLSSPEW